jgi:hypothetical protein
VVVGLLAIGFFSGSALVFAIFSGRAFMGVTFTVLIGMFAAFFTAGTLMSVIFAVFVRRTMLIGMFATLFATGAFVLIGFFLGRFFLFAGFGRTARTGAAFIIRSASRNLQAMAGHFGHLEQFRMGCHLSGYTNRQHNGRQHFFKVHEKLLLTANNSRFTISKKGCATDAQLSHP